MLNLINDYLEYSKIFKKKGTHKYDISTARDLIDCIKETSLYDYHVYSQKTIETIIIYFKRNRKCKNSKINSILGFMYKILNHYEINTNLPKKYKLPDDTQNFRALSNDDLKLLFYYLENNYSKYNLAVYILLESGVRYNELVNIKYENIDFNTRVIVLETTKNGKKRVARYGELSDKYIKEVEEDYFESITYSGLRHFFDKVKRKTGIKKLHPHMLRKTFATQLLKKGCPLTSIQKYLGHTDIKMTMIYLEIDIEMLDSDYNNYYPY